MKSGVFLLVFLSVIECSRIKFIDGYASMNFLYNLTVPWVSSKGCLQKKKLRRWGNCPYPFLPPYH